MKLPLTVSTCTSAALVLGSTRLLNFFPSFCYESKGWSSSKQSLLMSSTFLRRIVTAAAVYLDPQFTQSHCLIQCFCCPGSMSLTWLIPEMTFPFCAGCWPNMILSWSFMPHVSSLVEQQKVLNGIFVGPLLCVATYFARGLFTEIVLAEQGEEIAQPCTLQHGKFETLREYICAAFLIVIWLLILTFSLEGVHSFLLFCHVKFHTTAKLALTKGKSSDKIRRFCSVIVRLLMSWITVII